VKLSKDLAIALDDLLTRAFAEDGEDITSLAVFGPAARVSGKMVCREDAVISGLIFLPRLFSFLYPPATVKLTFEDGERAAPGTVLAEVEGPAITVLAGERTALNLVQRLSGIATLTRTFVNAVEGTSARILDTRKTTPGMRLFERYAVRCGGGQNHRFGLAHAFLVKDNHADGSGSVWHAARRAADFRVMNPSLRKFLLEVEVRDQKEVEEALDGGAERIMLDNMSTRDMKAAVKRIRAFDTGKKRRVEIEASGRMDPKRAREAGLAGIDFVSVGAITHSVRAIDIGLDVHVQTRPIVADRPVKKTSPRS
jgi:nicotinate-nucleotide pyrophosphorylase (carboxylating)